VLIIHLLKSIWCVVTLNLLPIEAKKSYALFKTLDGFLLSCSFGQIWDLASGVLKLTLTGHIEQVRGKIQKSYLWWQQL